MKCLCRTTRRQEYYSNNSTNGKYGIMCSTSQCRSTRLDGKYIVQSSIRFRTKQKRVSDEMSLHGLNILVMSRKCREGKRIVPWAECLSPTDDYNCRHYNPDILILDGDEVPWLETNFYDFDFHLKRLIGSLAEKGGAIVYCQNSPAVQEAEVVRVYRDACKRYKHEARIEWTDSLASAVNMLSQEFGGIEWKGMEREEGMKVLSLDEQRPRAKVPVGFDRDKAFRRQLNRQLLEHQHERYEVDIELAPGHTLEKFVVWPGVMRPDVMGSIWFARWLFFNGGSFNDGCGRCEKVAEIGCGSGILGITMAKYGADHVTMSDISANALANTAENIERYGLKERACVLESDLFGSYGANQVFDTIVFNHPFFFRLDIKKGAGGSMVAKQGLLDRFLDDARPHLVRNGRILMPWFSGACVDTYPPRIADQHGMECKLEMRIEVSSGLQQGWLYYFTLKYELAPD